MALFFILFFFLINPLYADEARGAVIISYHTGPDGERLDRIRFRLTDEHLNLQFFPQDGCCINEQSSSNRIVVIDDLTPGTYTIEFLVPNKDGLFGPISPKQVQVKPGERIRIDQYFHPHYASLRASAATGKSGSSFVSLPALILENAFHEVKARSLNGELTIRNLTPGSYTLIFGDLDGYKTPEKITFIAHPGESIGPFIGTYHCQMESNIPEDNMEASRLPSCMARVID